MWFIFFPFHRQQNRIRDKRLPTVVGRNYRAAQTACLHPKLPPSKERDLLLFCDGNGEKPRLQRWHTGLRDGEGSIDRKTVTRCNRWLQGQQCPCLGWLAGQQLSGSLTVVLPRGGRRDVGKTSFYHLSLHVTGWFHSANDDELALWP